ncbi:MAG: OmpA family protein [Pseudomonadales bacterium]
MLTRIQALSTVTLITFAVALMSGTAVLAAPADPGLRASLFGQVDEALVAANAARANVLAPKNYGEAARLYRDAEDKLQRGRSIDSIRSDLDEAAAALRRALEATKLANVTLVSAIQARNDADEADAKTFAPDLWQQAEERFASAATRLEDGNVNSARSRARTAEEQYREAELAAIKANYLDETRRLVKQAKSERVNRYAPETLARAESLLAQAESALESNRYDTDEPRSLARQAKYQAKHALYLARTLKPVRDRKVTLEQFALAGEQPIERIASALDLVAELDEGFDAPTTTIVDRIDTLQRDAYALSESRTEILALEEEIQTLEQQLGTQSARLATQEQQRQRIRQVESMFERDEAQIFTQGPNVLIRPVGLIFPSGSAQIETRYFALLRKLQDAVRTFPESTVVIEGHTDSFGGDDVNLRLSEQRAEAVRTYLLANMSELAAADVQWVGYGESRPVANNETVDGRAKNRRIDLVIRPKTPTMAGPTGGL